MAESSSAGDDVGTGPAVRPGSRRPRSGRPSSGPGDPGSPRVGHCHGMSREQVLAALIAVAGLAVGGCSSGESESPDASLCSSADDLRSSISDLGDVQVVEDGTEEVRQTVSEVGDDVARLADEARDAVSVLAEQSADRLQELVPIRYGRMLQTEFSFYRGAARVMAADLAGTARSGLDVQMCGDAPVSNFGFYGSPERRLVFDANDFDETLPGPFEFDVKRLVASLVVAGRANGLSRKRCRTVAVAAGARYRTAMAEFAVARDLEVWYSHIDADDLQQRFTSRLDDGRRKRLERALVKSRTRDTLQAFGKLTEVVDGRLRLRAEPPLVVPLRDLLPGTEGQDLTAAFLELVAEYSASLQLDRRTLLERYTFVDMARKVVGVGSVGTRCWIVLLTGRDEDDPLLLQVKEAPPSVHAEFVGASRYPNQGQRVVAGQRLMQQARDIFLGWQRTAGIDGVERG